MTVPEIALRVIVTYDGRELAYAAKAPIDAATPWMQVASAAVDGFKAARDELVHLVDRDRAALLAAEAESEVA